MDATIPQLPRFCPSGLPQHLVQRSNNRSWCIDSELAREITSSMFKNPALANERVKDQVEAAYDRRVKPGKIRRPKTTEKSYLILFILIVTDPISKPTFSRSACR